MEMKPIISRLTLDTITSKRFTRRLLLGSKKWELLLNHNDITVIPEDLFAGFTLIQVLSLRSNNLRTLPDKVFETGLKAVNVSILLAVNIWDCDFRIKYKNWTLLNNKDNDLVGDWWCYDEPSVY